MRKYRKRPVEVDAIQFDGTVDTAEAMQSLGYVSDWYFLFGNLDDPVVLVIDTLEGQMEARESDWIVRGVKGEYYPVKADIFQMTYEEVE